MSFANVVSHIISFPLDYPQIFRVKNVRLWLSTLLSQWDWNSCQILRIPNGSKTYKRQITVLATHKPRSREGPLKLGPSRLFLSPQN